MIKSFVLDTNILLSGGAAALYGFDDNNVIITGTTLQELDTKKTQPGEVGHLAREVIRELDALREKGDLTKGVKIGKGKIRVEPDGIKQEHLPLGFGIDRADNRIISACIHLAKKSPRSHFYLVTNDISMRVSADACFKDADVNIGIEGYRNDREKTDDEYMGYEVDEMASADLIDELYKTGHAPIGQYDHLYNLEFVILKNGSASAIAMRKGDRLVLIRDQKCFGVTKTLNSAQKMALYALLAPSEEIPCVILSGAAGSGKTFLSLAAALDGVYSDDRHYDKILIGRSNVSNAEEKDFGYLPGDLEGKMGPIIAPFTDNLESILRNENGKDESREQIQMHVEDIMETVVELNPLVYIRGRNLTRSYAIFDEAQNTTRRVLRDCMSRAGAHCKVVILGDPNQIDSPTLDRYSCGLTAAFTRMRGAAVILRLDDVVRSAFAKEAVERMS